MTSYIALGKVVLPRPDEFVERLIPILYRLSVHSHNDVPDDCRADSFVSNGKVNVWPVVSFSSGTAPSVSPRK
jgi:hypothetical protein